MNTGREEKIRHDDDRMLTFIDSTGLSMVETDGPYGGYTCSSSSHAHHTGYSDSVWQQNR